MASVKAASELEDVVKGGRSRKEYLSAKREETENLQVRTRTEKMRMAYQVP